MSRRLEFLLGLTQKSSDPFAWYGLAMEYRSLARPDDAVATFETLRARSPEYVPMYLMCAQVLESQGRREDARAWLLAGSDAARAQGEAHALSELQAALTALA
jgi:predicted Zn-dependent protease